MTRGRPTARGATPRSGGRTGEVRGQETGSAQSVPDDLILDLPVHRVQANPPEPQFFRSRTGDPLASEHPPSDAVASGVRPPSHLRCEFLAHRRRRHRAPLALAQVDPRVVPQGDDVDLYVLVPVLADLEAGGRRGMQGGERESVDRGVMSPSSPVRSACWAERETAWTAE